MGLTVHSHVTPKKHCDALLTLFRASGAPLPGNLESSLTLARPYLPSTQFSGAVGGSESLS